MKLLYISNDINEVKKIDRIGIDFIFIDLEINGKKERQGHLDTFISNHNIEDVKKIKEVLKNAKLLVRVNPIGIGSEEEINKVIEYGADVIMLPMFKTKEEVEKFILLINKRAKVCLLLETSEAFFRINDILLVEGIDYIHIGLNDLHLSLGLDFMFECLAGDLMEYVVNKIARKGIEFGIGGIARIGEGELPSEVILKEHVRLGSKMAILSRTFRDGSKELEKEIIKIREEYKKDLLLTKEELLENPEVKIAIYSEEKRKVQELKDAKILEKRELDDILAKNPKSISEIPSKIAKKISKDSLFQEYDSQISNFTELLNSSSNPRAKSSLENKIKTLEKEKEELSNQIIYTIGCVVAEPTEKQKSILEILARNYITMQIMDIDPLLSEFKSTLIREKVFIVDTDVLLYLITEEATMSRQYKKMVELLQKCGCKIYIPNEIITEVFNHAEAAKKRYNFVSYLIDTKGNLASQDLKNVFIEDYYYIRHSNESSQPTWDTYISNYYSLNHGVSFISEQIKDKLGDKIHYGTIPKDVKIDDALLERLAGISLEETSKTEKGQHRDEDKNQDIAKTDAQLYLEIKKLNEINNERIGRKQEERQDLLKNKYYILTNSTRVHYCAKQLGVSANILCKPASLMA